MKRFLLFSITLLFVFSFPPKACAQTNQTVSSGDTTLVETFPDNGCTYNWVNDTPGIGLAASGTGTIHSFTTINTGKTPITATITALPTFYPYAYINNFGDGTVSVINTTNNTVVATVAVGGHPAGAAVNATATRAYIANEGSNNVAVINTATFVVIAAIPVGSHPYGIVVSPDGSTVYVGNSSSNTVSVIDAATNTLTGTIGTGDGTQGLAVSPDGHWVYVTNSAGILVIDATSNTVTATIPIDVMGVDPVGITISPDGSQLYVANTGGSSVTVISTATNSITNTIAVGKFPWGIAVSPNGAILYTANQQSSTVSAINVATGTVVATVPVGSPPFGVAVNALGNVYVTLGNVSQVAVIDGSTNTVTTTVPVSLQPDSFGNFITPYQNCSGAPIVFTITVNPSPTITAGAVTGSISACPGTASSSPNIEQFTVSANNLTDNLVATAPSGFEVSLAAGSGYGASVSIAPTASTVNNTVIYVRSAAAALTGPISGFVVLTATGATSKNVAVTGTVASPVSSSITITGVTNNICQGSPVTFTATPVNGGSAPVYQWLVNGNNAGTNSATFTSSTLVNGDIITCMLTSSAGCAVPANATSNSITANFSPPVSPSVSIAASANNVCQGLPVTFTAAPVNGGNTPAYQWQDNGINTGANSPTFSSSSLANGDVISCVMTSSSTCVTQANATSNSVTVNFSSAVNPAISIIPSINNICAGTPVTFTATATNGGAAPVYQWLVNGNQTGTNSPTFSSSTLANGDVVTCVMTSNAACATPANITSNGITMVINAIPVVNAGGNKKIYTGNSVLLNATASGDQADITWTPATGLSNDKVLEPVASPVTTTTYTLTVQTTEGCIGTDSAMVVVTIPGVTIIVPNTFTPNGDGQNDTWDIKYISSYPNCNVRIFNRWGQPVFSSIGYGIAWDGTYKGARLPAGTYYYLIDLKNDSQLLSGFVLIVR